MNQEVNKIRILLSNNEVIKIGGKMIKEKYHIKQIPYKEAMQIIIKNHYLHRKSPCTITFGLLNIKEEIKGVIIYGVPASRALQKGVCGKEYAEKVGELTRLWVSDDVEKNGESFLIGNTLKLQPFQIIVSYADSSQNHFGVVYQATNWIYTGLSDKHCVWHLDGKPTNKHCRHLFDLYGGVEKAKKELGDRLTRGERSRKHRYVFFNCDKKNKKNLRAKLKYEIKPYPKQEINKETI